MLLPKKPEDAFGMLLNVTGHKLLFPSTFLHPMHINSEVKFPKTYAYDNIKQIQLLHILVLPYFPCAFMKKNLQVVSFSSLFPSARKTAIDRGVGEGQQPKLKCTKTVIDLLP